MPSFDAEAELRELNTSLRRARETTASFGRELNMLPKISLPPRGAARQAFEHFDIDGSGCLGPDEVLLGLRAYGLAVEAEAVSDIFDVCDADGDGKIVAEEFATLAEHVAALKQGAAWPRDLERLSNAARALHAQATSEPLTLVAEGEVPTLLRCAASGHAAVEQLGLSALATVAESPHSHCAQAIAARPALADVLAALARSSLPLPSVRQGARLLAALCLDASEARELGVRRKLRLRLYEQAGPLLHGHFGRRCAADDGVEHSAALAIGQVLCAFASEPELAPRMGTDGGGGALRLACELARAPSAAARAAGVEAICLCADGGDGRGCSANVWKLIGFGALEPLVVASASPATMAQHDGQRVDETATKALGLLGYGQLWKGVKGVDPLARFGMHR